MIYSGDDLPHRLPIGQVRMKVTYAEGKSTCPMGPALFLSPGSDTKKLFIHIV